MSHVEKIAQLGDKGKIKKIIPYAGSKDVSERVAAAHALGKCNDDDAYNTLVTMLRDPELSVQIAAVQGLGALGRPTGIEHVRHILSSAKDPDLVKACTEAMSKLQQDPDLV